MSLANELSNFRATVPGLLLSRTPARVCTGTGAVHKLNVNLARTGGQVPNEQFYKWQMIQGLIEAGLADPELIGTELSVPRGSRGSSDLFIDVVMFSDRRWATLYDDLKQGRSASTWDDLTQLIVGCGEIKDDRDDDPEETIARQLIPALNSVSVPYSLGFYYNAGHLVLLSRELRSSGTALTRIDPVRQGTGSGVRALNAAVPDTYGLFPPLNIVIRRGSSQGATTRAGRKVNDLDVTSSRSQGVVAAALEAIKRTLDQVSMTAEVGHRIVIETLAAKIHDERLSQDAGSDLSFYIDAGEKPDGQGLRASVRAFRDRLELLHKATQTAYPSIVGQSYIQFGNPAHLKIVAEVVQGFQDVSFLRSTVSDLYQVVFYNFAAPLAKAEQSQFVTPLQVIDFMVKMIHPAPLDEVCDPTMGIADFLAETYRYRSGLLANDRAGGAALPQSSPGADDRLYGVDNDANMRMLASLNMLLNGDGKAHLIHEPDTGSLDHKIVVNAGSGAIETYRLDSDEHATGQWQLDPASGRQLKHFDVVLTNPPFGDQRALKLNDPAQGPANRALAKLFAVTPRVGGNQIDRGLLFLENSVRILKPNGRFGIILSTSLAGVKEYENARAWLLENVRIVALFDLPENTFAETGVPTTMIFGYRPPAERLHELQQLPYAVFTQKIERLGFFKATRKRTALLLPKYLIDAATGVVQHDPATGAPLLDQEFDTVLQDFKQWAVTQEPEVAGTFGASS